VVIRWDAGEMGGVARVGKETSREAKMAVEKCNREREEEKRDMRTSLRRTSGGKLGRN